DVDEERLPRHREPPAYDLAVPDLLQRLGHLDELVPRARHLEALLGEQVLPVDEDRRRGGVTDAVGLAVPLAEIAERLDEVVLWDRVGEVVHRSEEPLRRERDARDRLAVRRVRRRAGRERGGELLFQVAPGEPLDLDRDVRVRLLILGSDLVQDREGLRLGLGLPEPDDLLVGRLSEDDDGEDQREERDGERASSDHGSRSLEAVAGVSYRRRPLTRGVARVRWAWSLRHGRRALEDELLDALAGVHFGRVDVPPGVHGEVVHPVELPRLAPVAPELREDPAAL